MTGARVGFQSRLGARFGVGTGWMDEAVCRGSSAEFFPLNGNLFEAREAKRVCAGCPVRAACLEHAIRQGEHDGIWGGLTALERERLGTRAVPAARHVCVACGGEVHGQGRSRYCSAACSRYRRCVGCGATFAARYRSRLCAVCRRHRGVTL